MKIRRALLCAMAAVMLFGMAGCGVLEKEYYAEKVHAQQYQSVEGTEAFIASNYEGLKDAVAALVWNIQETGTVQLDNYDGDVNEDLIQLRYYIMREDAFGAYCLDDIVFSVNRIVSYYEVSFQAQYNRNAREVDEIISVSDSGEAYSALSVAMNAHWSKIVMKLSYFNGWEEQIDAYCEEIYYTDPRCAFIMPEVSWDVYPEGGTQRIISVRFEYYQDDANYLRIREMTMSAAQNVLSQVDTSNLANYADRQKAAIYELYKYLQETVSYDEETVMQQMTYGEKSASLSTTAFGALVDKKATGEGTALAFKLLCDSIEIECIVVKGYRDYLEHAWNIVCVGGEYFHVDATDDNIFLYNDYSMPKAYIWNEDEYPDCV